MITNVTLAGADLYDRLYSSGYHSRPGLTHATYLLHELRNMSLTTHAGQITSVLDVGCSHGAAVASLWRCGIAASGVDVSEVAVSLARRLRLGVKATWRGRVRLLRCAEDGSVPKCSGPCFSAASVTSLPFPNRSFDALLSSDVLEHLEAAEVAPAVREIARVTRRLLFLKISSRHESGNAELAKLRAAGLRTPAQLHLTARRPRFWLEHFRAVGFELHHTLEETEHMAWLRKMPHMCCSLVLERREQLLS